MVNYITFCEMTPEFLQLSLEERNNMRHHVAELAKQYGIKVELFGMPLGVNEHLVIVFEVNGNNNKFFLFQREWLKLGTPDAGKYIRNTRSITVY
jgi:hypothetical protein